MRKTLIAISAIAVAALLAVPGAAAKHTIEITSGEPTEGSYTLRVEVENFQLVDFMGREAKKGEGHIHYLINGKPCNPDDLPAEDADKCGGFYATPSKSFAYKDLDGDDVVGAELVLSDHTPSGTDAGGNLNGARVLSEASVGGDEDAPGPGVLLLLGAVAVAFLARRR